MIFRNVPIVILSVQEKSGTSKASLKPYHFYTVQFADESLDKFEAIVPRSALVEGVVPEWLLNASKLACFADVQIQPTGNFGIKLSLVEINQE